MTFRSAVVLLIALLAPVLRGDSGAVRDLHVEAELVTGVAAVVPGSTFTVALRLKHDPHWHTYWKNPGDAGLATEIDWKLPEGFSAGPIQWPVPDITDTSGLVTYGYGEEIFLLIDIQAPANLRKDSSVDLAATATWLMCEDVCIPGEAALSLTIPVGDAAGTNSKWAESITAARDALPKPSSKLEAKGYRSGNNVTLVIDAAEDLNPSAGGFYFFDDQGFVEAGIEQKITRSDRQVRIELVQTAYAKNPSRMSGLIRAEGGWFTGGAAVHTISFEILDARGQGLTLDNGDSVKSQPLTPSQEGFATVLVLAFLGGLILNVMPCVFPVIGIKIMGFVNQAGEARGQIVKHGLVFTSGVLVSFWLLSGLLLVLRSGGAQLGWGFQLQSAEFVFVLAAILLVFGLSMSGVFEIGGSLIGAGSNLQAKSGLGGSFFSGVLATVVATPCAAPMLGPALAAALSLPPAQSVITFTVIALGLAAPYLLLSVFPGAVRFLPKPGVWMETFKQAMAFLLYGTVAYLVWVLAAQVDGEGFQNVLLGLVGIAVACWVLGRWSTPSRDKGVRIAGRLAAAAALVGGLAYGMPGTGEPAPDEIVWEPWSDVRVAELVKEGRPVYVDFTARWCVTCQANKKLVFGSGEVREFFREHGIATLRADWTNRDPAITAELERWGQTAVPFNLVYLPGEEPKPLPVVLTPGIVLDVLEPLAR